MEKDWACVEEGTVLGEEKRIVGGVKRKKMGLGEECRKEQKQMKGH